MFESSAGKYESFYGSNHSNRLMEHEDVHKMMSILNPEDDLIHDTVKTERQDDHKILHPHHYPQQPHLDSNIPLRTIEPRTLPTTIPVILLQTSQNSQPLRTIPSVSSMQVPPISTLVSLDDSHMLPFGSATGQDHEDDYDSADKTKKKQKKRKVKGDDGEGSALTNEQFWLERFNELKEFHRQYHHCNPSYLHHSQLYSWLHRQKFLFRKGKLPKERFDMLVDLGVHFDYHWDEMYQQLKDYKEENSGSTVTSLEFDAKLSSWVWAQIYAWRSGKLSEERIQKMGGLGLSPDMDSTMKPPKPPSKKKRKKAEEEMNGLLANGKRSRSAEKKSEQNWVIMYKKLKEFKQHQHTLTVPMKHDKKLSLWVRTQRKMWREGKLYDWKQKKLEKLGLTPNFELSSKREYIGPQDFDDDPEEQFPVVPHVVPAQAFNVTSHLDNDESENDIIHAAHHHPIHHDIPSIMSSEDETDDHEEQVYGSITHPGQLQQPGHLLPLSLSEPNRVSHRHLHEDHLDMLAYLTHTKEQPYLEHVTSADHI